MAGYRAIMDSKLQAAEDSSMGKLWPALLFVIIAAAIAIRLIAAFQSAIVNADAAVYIHQARAIYYGDWEALDDTAVKYLTPYPVFIAVTRLIIGDWIVAATAVSLVFSVLMLIFLYLLSRQFFDRSIALCIFAVFAFHPLFVTAGIDIIKDPLAWCLLVAGMWLFVRGQTGARWLSLTASSILFAFAAWVRVESAMFFFAGAVYLAFFEKGDREKKLVAFLAPALLALVAVVSVVVFTGKGQMAVSRLGEIGPRLALVSEGYQNVRAGLKELSGSPPPGIPAEYFDQIRSLTWLVGLAAILRNAVEAFYPPVFALFLFGLGSTPSLFAADRRTAYFLAILVLLLVFFYAFIFSSWVLEQRWLAPAVLASFVFIGFGLQQVAAWGGHFIRVRKDLLMAAAAGLILIASIPKILASSERDKAVFVEIARKISDLKPKEVEARILASGHTIRWLSLYANLNVEGAPSPDHFQYDQTSSALIGKETHNLLRNIKSNGVDFFLYEQRHWPKEAFEFQCETFGDNFETVGHWSHPDTGNMILFRVKKDQ